MTHTDIDQRFIDTVYHIMQSHQGVDNRISRPGLLAKVMRYYPSASDRQVRDALAQTPVISSSGIGGYWLPATRAEVDAYVAELTSRQASIAERKRLVQDYIIRKHERAAEQLGLL